MASNAIDNPESEHLRQRKREAAFAAATANDMSEPKTQPAWLAAATGSGRCFRGGLDFTTRVAGIGESSEGWAIARSADGVHVLLKVGDRHGDDVRLTLSPEQSHILGTELLHQAMEAALTRCGHHPNAELTDGGPH